MLKTKASLDRRDRRLLHAIRIAAEDALFKASHGHTDGWKPLRDALDKANDEMGEAEDFEI